jgi:uncharacterized protein DUF2336
MQREAREASAEHEIAARDAKRRFRMRPITEASVHGPARAQEFEKTVVALTRLGHFSVDVVERALLDQGQDMVLLLAKAAGCTWTTARELLVMYAAGRNLSAEDVSRAFERYRKLRRETAQNIVSFHERYVKPRVEAEVSSGPDTAEVEADDALLAPVADNDASADAPA